MATRGDSGQIATILGSVLNSSIASSHQPEYINSVSSFTTAIYGVSHFSPCTIPSLAAFEKPAFFILMYKSMLGLCAKPSMDWSTTISLNFDLSVYLNKVSRDLNLS